MTERELEDLLTIVRAMIDEAGPQTGSDEGLNDSIRVMELTEDFKRNWVDGYAEGLNK